MDPFKLRDALDPPPPRPPVVTVDRAVVTGPGMVQVGAADPEPVDGPTGTAASGMVLSVDGMRILIPHQTDRLRAPGGAVYRLVVSDAGVLSVVAV